MARDCEFHDHVDGACYRYHSRRLPEAFLVTPDTAAVELCAKGCHVSLEHDPTWEDIADEVDVSFGCAPGEQAL